MQGGKWITLGSVIVVALGVVVSAEAGAVVEVGLERVRAERGGRLRGKNVGLVVHAASVTCEGRHAIDVLRSQGIHVRRLFAPEHGVRGGAAAGEKLVDGTDADTGLPVVSLYGTRTAPRPSDLADLDALVFDLQDAGVRFYTYVSTLLFCLEAASEAGVELVVLDRPNPLGGERVEGPERDPEVAATLVSLAPGPLVHGLTLGEMARFANARRAKPVRLSVVPMKGWTRSMLWMDTGFKWVPPSPNLRSAEAALVYPGTCLLEATNVSEGRGTEAPFLLFGAPWIKAAELTQAVLEKGFTLVETEFTPRPSAAAPAPLYDGIACSGVRVQVAKRPEGSPYALGLRLLRFLRDRRPEFRWKEEGRALDRLLGTRKVRLAIESGESVEAILAVDREAVAAFRRERGKALLYD